MFNKKIIIKKFLNSGSCAKIYLAEETPSNDNNNVIEKISSKIEKNINKTIYFNFYKENSFLPGTQIIIKSGQIPEEEIKFLKNVQDVNFFIKILGELNFGIFNDEKAICLEYVEFDLNLYYNKNIKNNNDKNYKQTFLEKISYFFINVLDYFKKNNQIYGDWKFENILVDTNENFKLTDFGSIMKNNKKIQNLKNINILYSSPYISQRLTEIIPNFADDYKSVSYIFWNLNGNELPWSYVYSQNVFCENDLIKKIYEIDKMKLDFFDFFLDTSDCIYWPKHFYFSFLNKYFKL